MFLRRKNEEENPIVDTAESNVIKRRPQTNVIIQVRIRPDQIALFETDLEELCNKYINMKDDEVAPPPDPGGALDKGALPGYAGGDSTLAAD